MALSNILRDPLKPHGAESDRKCATKGCKRRALSASDYCADCWDQMRQQFAWFQRQGVWSGK